MKTGWDLPISFSRLFLFIVGLSIPFAIGSRMARGDSKYSILLHILRRTLALVVMGFFMVNQENFSRQAPDTLRTAWDILMIIAFILIWNNYEGKKVFGKVPVWLLQVTGIAILVVLAFIYKGGTADDPQWMRPHWWGILGLIGWAYLVCAMHLPVFGKQDRNHHPGFADPDGD